MKQHLDRRLDSSEREPLLTTSESMRCARAYWDDAAATYDHDFPGTLIGQTRRAAVWRELDRVFFRGQRVLEFNCGTGIDAVHLAEKGVRILACDIAPQMIELAVQRANKLGFQHRLDFRVLATEDAATLEEEGPFDGAFSNFSGLNCVEDLGGVARTVAHLLKPGARVLVCMLGRFVPWELLWFLIRGDPENAIRRFRAGTRYSAEKLQVQYHSVPEIIRCFAPELELRKWMGIGIAVPPSYMEHWARRLPAIIHALARADRLLGSIPISRSMADCVLLEFERRGAPCNQ